MKLIAVRLVRGCLMVAVAFLSAGAGLAADFRVDNSVFAEGHNEPVSRSTTLFCDGYVYDFMAAPAEVIVLDVSGGRFVLLDVAKRRSTSLKTSELTDIIEKLRQQAAESKEGMIRWLAAPKFEETYNASTGRLTLASPSLTYAAIVKRPAEAAVVNQTREFSDWLTQLNTLLNAGARPPFVRMALNEALALHKTVATEVSLTTTTKGGQSYTVRSQHEWTERLTQDDRDRVAEAKKFMAEFTAVPFKDFRK